MTLAGWIGIGAAAGLATGIAVGERCAVLQPVGNAYVMLLESVVYPYVISSLLHGLGRLSPKVALQLLKKSWPFYLAAWGGTLGVIWLLGLAFPSAPPPIMVDATQSAGPGADFLELILPSNVFRDLERNYVPAVVMLSVLFGVAIQGIKGKEAALDLLALVRTACVRIWNWVVVLAPVAVFAMFAFTAGTTELAKAGGLAAYVGLFLIACALLAFFAIPAVISALIPVGYRQVIADLHNAFTLALVTTLSVVALPFIQQAAVKLAQANDIQEDNRDEIIDTCLAVNYPLGQLGNFFVFFFMLFTVFYTRTAISPGQEAALPFMTLFSCFGSPTSTVNAVDFLGQWLNLPGRPVDLYVETMMITRYGQVALSVMGFAFLTLLMTFNYFGKIRLRPGRLAATLAGLALLVGGLAYGGHELFVQVLKRPQETYLSLELSPETTRGVEARVYTSREEFLRETDEAELPRGESVLERVQRTQTLRVGYARGIVPFAYRNHKGDLVGHDVAAVYDLARGLGVKLAFVPVVFELVADDVRRGLMDIWAGGVYVMESRMLWGAFSHPYFHSPLALITPSANVDRCLDLAAMRGEPGFTLAIMDNPSLRILARRLFPWAKLMRLASYDDLPDKAGWSAALWTLEQAAVWASGHPGYTAVRPADMGAVVIFAFMMPKRSDQMVQFVNHWLAMRKADGHLARLKAYWIEGSIAGGMQPRRDWTQAGADGD